MIRTGGGLFAQAMGEYGAAGAVSGAIGGAVSNIESMLRNMDGTTWALVIGALVFCWLIVGKFK
jgi:hypothetical protein